MHTIVITAHPDEGLPHANLLPKAKSKCFHSTESKHLAPNFRALNGWNVLQ